MTPQAQKLVIDRLTNHNFDPRHKIEVMRIVKFIEQGEGSDGTEFLRQMQRTDDYREQSFIDTHQEIAEAMGYE
jgi:hypothetical protein